jgi:hypothetical protein
MSPHLQQVWILLLRMKRPVRMPANETLSDDQHSWRVQVESIQRVLDSMKNQLTTVQQKVRESVTSTSYKLTLYTTAIAENITSSLLQCPVVAASSAR